MGFLTKWSGPLSNMWKKKHNKVESVLCKRAGKTSNEANIEILKKKTLHNSAKKTPKTGSILYVCVEGG